MKVMYIEKIQAEIVQALKQLHSFLIKTSLTCCCNRAGLEFQNPVHWPWYKKVNIYFL